MPADPPSPEAENPSQPTGDLPPAEPPVDARLHQLLDRTVAFVALLSPDGRIRDVSQSALDVGGLSPDQALGHQFWAMPWWSHDQDVARIVAQAVADAREGRTSRFDTVARTADAGRLAIDFQASPILDAAGRVSEIVASAVDISDRVAQRERMEGLLQEMGHRIKNLLATVQAMARLTEQTSSPGEAFPNFRARLDALVAAHDLLNESGNAQEFFALLVRRILSHFVDDGQRRLSVLGPDRPLARDGGKLLALCVHELATNSLKYGALSNDTGRVAMSLDVDPEAGTARFAWEETGGPAVASTGRQGYGTRFLIGTLGTLFEGTPRFDLDPGGLRVTVTGPAPALFAAG